MWECWVSPSAKASTLSDGRRQIPPICPARVWVWALIPFLSPLLLPTLLPNFCNPILSPGLFSLSAFPFDWLFLFSVPHIFLISLSFCSSESAQSLVRFSSQSYSFEPELEHCHLPGLVEMLLVFSPCCVFSSPSPPASFCPPFLPNITLIHFPFLICLSVHWSFSLRLFLCSAFPFSYLS